MEKTIHLTIKNYIEPDKKYHEVNVGNFIADIKRDNKIVEIQTKDFKKLISKIEYYIDCGYETVIVYPLVVTRYVNWLDNDGAIVDRNKSQIKGVIQDSLLEVYWICKYLGKIKLQIILLEAEEFKLLNSKYMKYKASKIDKIPTRMMGTIEINDISDLKIMVPNTLKDRFTTQEFIKASKSRKKYIGSGVKLLRELGIIKQVDKVGNTIIYERNF